MKLNSQQLETVRVSLVRYIRGAEVIGTAFLAQAIRNEGFKMADSEVRGELHYLAGKKLIAKVDKILSPENEHWSITAEGRDFLAATGQD